MFQVALEQVMAAFSSVFNAKVWTKVESSQGFLENFTTVGPSWKPTFLRGCAPQESLIALGQICLDNPSDFPLFVQTCKISEILPTQDCSFSRFYPKVRELRPSQIAIKQRNLSENTMFTTFTSFHNVYQIFTKKTHTKKYTLPKVNKSYRSVLGWGESNR